MHKEKSYPKGHFIGIGLAIGIPLGIPIGMAIGQLALGPALGLPLGLGIGIWMEKKWNPNPVEQTAQQKKRQAFWSLIGVGIGLIAVITLGIFYFRG